MKATPRHIQPVDAGQVPFASSLVLSICLHSALVLWLIGSAWLLSRSQPYRLSSYTVSLGGDSPFAIDQIPGEGGAGAGVKQEPGTALQSAQAEVGAEPSVEKFAPPVEKPPPPPPKPAVEKPREALPPEPVEEQAAPPPPKPIVEKPVPPTPAPKPVVDKAVPALPKPPPEAMTLAQKETKPTTPPPLTSTATEAQQALAKLRERQVQHELDVNLPVATGTPQVSAEDRVVLTVNKQGNIYLDQTAYTLDTLRPKLQALYQTRRTKDIFLRADADVPYGKVVQVMDEVKKAGILKLGMITQPPAEKR